MKQTAVEWLIDKLGIEGIVWLQEDFEQALKMEKEQILDAHIKGHNAPSSTIKNWDAEKYYNETFKQQEQ
jgi:hypothetical protein